MKKADHPTEYMLIKATTGSEWDSCEFAILHISNGFLQALQQRINHIDALEADNSFASLTYYCAAVEFYLGTLDDTEPCDELLEEGAYATYITLDQGESDMLVKPQSVLDSYELRILSKTDMLFSALGKHTSEEFWTEHISPLELLQQAREARLFDTKS